ncbi:MAG: hypothetical protein CVU06_01535 [Bacteroidetes bacterium HGW-Bacteroidetes-22]|nr:MAG: hypothetical protein CVU06_01535 [Bacteroidetes bacterium HGW-Bacteroidetes-22]
MLLQQVDPDEATGKVADVYRSMMKAMGMIPNAFKMYSVSEELLVKQYEGLAYFMANSGLSGKLLAFIRLLVSYSEQCDYCVGVNTGILMQYGVLPGQIPGIRQDPSTAPLPENELKLLLFVLQAVNSPASIEEGDITPVRNVGWTDKQIFDATFHGAMQVASDKLLVAFKVIAD